MRVIYCKEIADSLKDEYKRIIEEHKVTSGKEPTLCVIMVGDDEASKVYVRNKTRACDEVGIKEKTILLSRNTTQEELEKVIIEQNENPDIDGILVQLPLPWHLNERQAINTIDPKKDVDGLHPLNIGRLITGEKCFTPCTPKGCIRILEHIGYMDLKGLRAVVCGRSVLVGKPMATLLQERGATVTIVHSATQSIKEITSQADVLVVAMGRNELVDESWVKDGAVVIDVGINRVNGKIVGDCKFDSVCKKAAYVTPVPKGVGVMTVCMLLENTLESYLDRIGVRKLWI